MKYIAIIMLVLCTFCAWIGTEISSKCSPEILERFKRSADLATIVETATQLMIDINTTGGSQIVEKT